MGKADGLRGVVMDEARRAAFRRELQALFRTEFDETLSEFRADELVSFVLKAVGPAIYNQAVQDVRAHFQSKLDDLDGEIYAD